ncbi:hypothetical protein OCU04_009909 [Sclerotinia nivalis]|uniref:Uncharacterized protein n=1 Tax=Sclerotinia nivalis TaxID=352851 RepID=A0A9X0DFQ3_9HELO|nr:hypothetical protein OCU04_009909 [Sclerotinia nivalis]
MESSRLSNLHHYQLNTSSLCKRLDASEQLQHGTYGVRALGETWIRYDFASATESEATTLLASACSGPFTHL